VTDRVTDRPSLQAMGAATRELHTALDARARADGIAWLHPEHRTIQRDLLGSPTVVAWQEAKAGFLIAGDGAWSELPHLYARYGTPGTAALIAALRGGHRLRHAGGRAGLRRRDDRGLARGRDAAGLQQDEDLLRVEREAARCDDRVRR